MVKKIWILNGEHFYGSSNKCFENENVSDNKNYTYAYSTFIKAYLDARRYLRQMVKERYYNWEGLGVDLMLDAENLFCNVWATYYRPGRQIDIFISIIPLELK